jgi:hypothetical protein
MAYIIARFLILLDPIVAWSKEGKHGISRQFFLYTMSFLAGSVPSFGLAAFFGFPAVNLGTIVFFIGGFLLALAGIITAGFTFFEYMINGGWASTGDVFFKQIRKAKQDIRAQKNAAEAPANIQASNSYTPDDLEYLR